MFQLFVDYASFIALVMLACAVGSQMFKIHTRGSAEDFSLLAISMRLTAILIILIKMITLRDVFLISGQCILLFVYVLYAVQVIYWKRKFRI